MIRTHARASALLLLPATLGFIFFSASPSMADSQKCAVSVIGVGVNCKDKTPSTQTPTETPPPTPTQAPAAPVPTQAPVPSPVDTPSQTSVQNPAANTEPEPTPTVTVVKEVVIVPAPSPATATPTPSEFPAAVAPHDPSSDSTPLPTLAIDGEAASEKSGAPDLLKQAGSAAPYAFFIGLAGVTAMLIVGRSKKLFPFEDKRKA